MRLDGVKLRLVVAVIFLIVALMAWYLWKMKNPADETVNLPTTPQTIKVDNKPSDKEKSVYQTIRASSISGAEAAYRFSAEIPEGWQAEAEPTSQSLIFYDPNQLGGSNLEKAEIFVRHFSANQFLTLTTVNVLAKEELTVNGRPAVRYRIAKKPAVADFPNQPKWRNEEHIVTDIRVSDANPSVFYVIAKRPSLSDEIYQRFLTGLQVVADPQVQLFEPIAEFQSRITKKSFGTFVTPTDSPVTPERFSGYHTGVDVEYDDISTEVSVRSIADGTILTNQIADGYGGVLAISHLVKDQSVVAIYGHLDPKSLPAAKVKLVKGGEAVGRLGDGFSDETDNERKHLHFALVKGTKTDLRGYVNSREELSAWHDPLSLY